MILLHRRRRSSIVYGLVNRFAAGANGVIDTHGAVREAYSIYC